MGSARSYWVMGLWMAGALGLGCSSTSTVKSNCNAGDQRGCECDDGTPSVQVCESNGAGYASCECQSGSGGTSGSGGSAGSSSAAGSAGFSGGNGGSGGSGGCAVDCMGACCGQGETCDTGSGVGICKCGGQQKAGGAVCGAGEFCDPQEQCRCGVRASGSGHACGDEETCSDNACTCGSASNPNGKACSNLLLRCDGAANECVCASTACGPNSICCGINETCENDRCTCGSTVAADENSIACTATGYCSGSTPKACDTG